MTKSAKTIPEGYHTITPQLSLDNAAQSIDWYKKAFGAQEISRNVGPDGKIMHAVLKIGNSLLGMSDVMGNAKGPKAFGGSPVVLWLYVDQSDALYKRAVDAGAKVHMPIDDQFWGDHAGAVTDPAGYIWWIATHVEDLTTDQVQKRAADFFKHQPQPTH